MRHILAGITALCIAGCGGGGGSGMVSTTTPVTDAAVASLKFQYYASSAYPISYIYTKDIDGDGIDEIFFAAFQSQPATPETYTNTSIHIFGWQHGQFREITDRWLPNDSNKVQGVGDVCFGDFNGDGLVDVFLSAYTDMNLAAVPYVLINLGSSFEKKALSAQTWQHGVACGDINNDGFDDVVPVGWSSMPTYIGSPQGLMEYQGALVGAGVSLGRFNGNSVQAVVTDVNNQGPNDTRLFSISVDSKLQTVTYQQVLVLPPVLIDQNLNTGNASHDMRVRAVDFDNDGLTDIVVFSVRAQVPVGSTYQSEIQFLKNTGNRIFVDVTDSIRQGYNTASMLGYVPNFKDFNNDGLLDLFVSGVADTGTNILLQNSQGQFVSRSDLITTWNIQPSEQVAIAKGPGNQFYLVKETSWTHDGWTKISIKPISF